MVEEKTRTMPSIGTEPTVKLPVTLRNWFEIPDRWSRDQESLKMRHNWLLAERDEVVQYVKMLKKLAVYLGRKTNGNVHLKLGAFFEKAEQNFPEYLCNEMAIRLVEEK